ncbi:response regulator [Cellulomonas carbonis]|uniref:Chemotaxis protein CheY n=1 Tax=Cellulomonas carbonis T26 TaxID=947969 RepID=A0A0A0BPW6_9CELL|nr:response regulator [Cellulomonas carbonis]KGM10528.1 chemotaxis protein CheY [Cellulomonas carbonis T26]GGB93049.1 hypothetical protein GCM10010972_02140 [Cellulomonas carbonis]
MATTDVHDEWDDTEEAGPAALRVLLYSTDATTREAVRLAVGRRVAPDLPPVEWVEVATGPVVVRTVEEGRFDLLVLDGEAAKTGGIGLCRQLKDEIFRCPPVLLVLGRAQDAWLASSADPDAVVAKPLDPIVVQDAVAGLLRAARAA